MRGNSHVRFLGEGAAVTPFPLPDKKPKFGVPRKTNGRQATISSSVASELLASPAAFELTGGKLDYERSGLVEGKKGIAKGCA